MFHIRQLRRGRPPEPVITAPVRRFTADGSCGQPPSTIKPCMRPSVDSEAAGNGSVLGPNTPTGVKWRIPCTVKSSVNRASLSMDTAVRARVTVRCAHKVALIVNGAPTWCYACVKTPSPPELTPSLQMYTWGETAVSLSTRPPHTLA